MTLEMAFALVFSITLLVGFTLGVITGILL